MDEEDLGFDGPDIRPPQASKGPPPGGGARNFGSSRADRDRRQGYNAGFGGGSNYRNSSNRNNHGGGTRGRQGENQRDRGSYGSLGHRGRGAHNTHGRDKSDR